ncbi:MAG: response regulator transcription factor [Clostridiales bacterium]|nr:response regulator transcription factor [Clostridiales bacterium]
MNYTILIVEDDEDIVELLRLYLENENYQVLIAKNGEEALPLIESNRIDLAVIDIMMPKMNGYELTKYIRKVSNMPIIILSAKNLDSDKILGLNIGADDYMTKPFNPLEIIARVKSNIRRYYNLNDNLITENSNHLVVGELEMDMDLFTVAKAGKIVNLTPMEYKILATLMKNPGRVLTKVQIYENINGEYFESDDNTMMVHISKLREKIEEDPKQPCYIKTVRGIGYKIEKKK